MRCEEVKEGLSELYDGQLVAAAESEIRRHLAACSGCREEEARYRELLDGFGSYLHRAADAENPSRPFPRLEDRRPPGWLPLALGLAAAASLVLLIGRAPGSRPTVETRVASGQPALVSVGEPSRVNHVQSCPWSSARPEELARVVTYPVVDDECLEERYELVEATVRTAAECPEAVRLTYRAGGRHLTLDQTREMDPDCHCAGERVPVGDLVACLEPYGDRTSLQWSQKEHTFRLTGEVELDEAVRVASSISSRFAQR